MNTAETVRSVVRLVAVCALLAACATPLIAPFNETAYGYATSLKRDSLAVMDKATEPYADHSAEVSTLMERVDEACAFVESLPRNEQSAEQWRILKDRERDLLGGFMRRWESEGRLSRTFIQNAKEDTIGPAFDEIIALEASKRR